jgi:hypothetical protein
MALKAHSGAAVFSILGGVMEEGPCVAVLGFRPHTYWTSVVALAGDVEAPRVIERRAIVFAAGEERNVYHHAAETDLAAAPALIERVRAATKANAVRELGGLIADLGRTGAVPRTAVTAAATAKLPAKLEDIVRVHARMHAAEGDFYRDVVADACQAAGLDVRRVVERELPDLVCDLLRIDSAGLKTRLHTMGAALGPPWSEDYRLASLAAWLGLEAAGA